MASPGLKELGSIFFNLPGIIPAVHQFLMIQLAGVSFFINKKCFGRIYLSSLYG